MIYKVWIHIEQIDEGRDHYLNLDPPYEAGKFDTEDAARNFVDSELMTTRITGSAADLLEACKVLTSYTTDLLYRLDDQADLSDVEEVQQARNAIARYSPVETTATKLRDICRQVLHSMDVGGEQSRAFAEEIALLKDALKVSPAVKDDCPQCGAG